MKITKIVAGAALAASLVAGAAEAAPTSLNGTGAAAVVGISSSTASIGIGTTFTNTLMTIIGSATGDLAGTAGTMLTLAPVTATLGSAVSFTSGVGNFAGTVDWANATGSTTNRTLELYALGTFTPSGSLSSYKAGAMSLTFSFTQTGGVGSAVSASFSLSSPPTGAPGPVGVPEPMSLALFGMGLAGLGVVTSRKKA